MTSSLDATASAAARDRPSARPAVQLPIALQANALQALCRQVFAFRLVMIALATPVVLSRTAPGAPTHLAGGAVLLTFLLSYVLLRDWERFGPLLLRHRWPLAVDWAFFGGLLFLTATPAPRSSSPRCALHSSPGSSTAGPARRSTRWSRRPWWRWSPRP